MTAKRTNRETSGNPLEADLGGINLIEASAGTGKTYAITGLFVRAILEKRLEVDRILVVTYTEAATEELKGRIRDTLREAARAFRTGEDEDDEITKLLRARMPDAEAAAGMLETAIRDFDKASIFTIHGFCSRILRENAFESGISFDTELVTDDTEIIRQITHDFWRRHVTDATDLYVEYLGMKKPDGEKPVDPDALFGLARLQKGALPFRVIPDTEPDTAPGTEEQLVRTLRDAFQGLVAAWPRVRDGVCDLLVRAAANGDVNKGTYGERAVRAWRTEMDALCAAGHARLSLPPKFEKCTISGLKRGTNKKGTAPAHPFFDRCEEVQAAVDALSAFYGALVVPLKRAFLEYVRREYERIKRDRGVQTFDDLLVDVHRALEGENADVLARVVRERYPIALIDEFQDTDPVQYRIFRRIYEGEEGTALFMIGDPKQSIYAFRGADVLSYVQAGSDARETYHLHTNWRSEEALVRAVNTVFASPENPFIFETIPFRPVKAAPADRETLEPLTIGGAPEAPLRIWMLSRGAAGERALKTSKNTPAEKAPISKEQGGEIIRKRIAEEIARLVNAGREGVAFIGSRPLQPGDIAVLVRSHREAGAFQEELRRTHVASVLYSDKSLMSSREMAELERIFAAVASWRDGGLVRSALVTNILGVDGNELHAATRDEQVWERYQADFRHWHDLWQERGFIQMFRAMLGRRDVARRLLSLTDGERRLTNVLHAGELLQKAAVERKLGMSGLLKWLADERRDSDLEAADERQLRLESDEKRVKVITMHRVKGLEFPVVFCPSLWNGYIHADEESLFHDPEHDNEITLDLGSGERAAHARVAVREERAEALRLAYVALTRAQNLCYTVVGPITDYETSALAYLFHQGDRRAGTDLLDAASTRAADISDEEMEKDLRTLEKKAKGAIAVSPVPEEEDVRAAPPAYGDPTAFAARAFEGSIRREWCVTSYSGLTRGAHAVYDLQDHDQHDLTAEELRRPLHDSIFTFPRGAAPGSMIHRLFERLGFGSDDDTVRGVVESELKRAGYDTQRWVDIVAGMVKNVVSTPLNADGLTLASVPQDDRLCEMEFYYPLGHIAPDGLAEVLGSHPLAFSPRFGFMKGFVDLTFRSGDRYYILDYKSNCLGFDIDAYHRDRLGPEMAGTHYDLQYHVYTVALHRYLEKRLDGYDYERNYGGAFYLFVRGMDPGRGCDCGVFFDRPSKELTETLSAYLAGGAS